METTGAAQAPETLLRDFWQATDEAAAHRLLERLVQEHARPVVQQVLNSALCFKLGGAQFNASRPDAEDVYGEVTLALLRRLRSLKENPGEQSITNFRAYVAVTAYNACYEYLRQKFPRRWRLVNRLRYLLTHRQEFALWGSAEGVWLGGFVGWRHRKLLAEEAERGRRLCESQAEFGRLKEAQPANARRDPAASLDAVFAHVGCPVQLDQLVTLMSRLWVVKELSLESLDDEERSLSERVPDTRLGHDAVFELQLSLRQLWAEVCQLPPRQRAALLLNLRDKEGRDVITLLPYTRTATIRQIAEVLEIPLAKFTVMWNELPLEDAVIAAELGLTRQQVINLRKCARERLARRLKVAPT